MKRFFSIYLLFVVVCNSNASEPIRNHPEKIGITGIDIKVHFRQLPIVDLNKSYPETKIKMEEISDVEYIPLETTNEVLVDKASSIPYVSDKRIIVTNDDMGDVYIFSRNGKILSRFNHKGRSAMEYTSIAALAYDEKKKEIFIIDYLAKRKILVYSEDGKFLRTFYFPPNSWINELYNFDDQTLLAYNDYNEGLNISEINQKKPYVFLSKKDGSIVSRLNITLPKRISNNVIVYKSGDEERTIGIGIGHDNRKYGREFIIADKSSDTVYLLTQDKKLTPLFVRKPSVFHTDPHVVMTVHVKTDNFLCLMTVPYDFQKATAQHKKGQPFNPQIISLMYDLHTGQAFKNEDIPFGGKKMDIPENTIVRKWSADVLKERLEKGKLEGQLKQVAQKLDEEDNPVVEIIKFK